MQNLPTPSAEAQQLSDQLISHIRNEITTHDNAISFYDYMGLALYAPELGYYRSGLQKFGAQGDFTTAPEISPLYAKCLAKQTEQVLAELDNGNILEFGAGTGILAADLLLELEAKNSLPTTYNILELSAELQQRQRKTLQQKAPHLLDRINWLTELPTDFKGIIIANEVLDAMPVIKIKQQNGKIYQSYVAYENNHFKEIWQLCDDENILAEISNKLAHLDKTISYETEYNPNLTGWLQSISQCLSQGLVLLIDYGFPEHEYYHPERNHGTIMCHYQHRAHTDPFILTGLQDITAHVDFTAVAECAFNTDLHVAGYTSQASFLVSCGIAEFAVEDDDIKQQIKTSQQIQLLTSPSEMGELFKVIALSRDLDSDLLGFRLQDRRGGL